MRKWGAATSAILFFSLFVLSPAFSARYLNNHEIVGLINALRKRQGMRPLRENPRLDRSSRLKVIDMARQGYFGHTGPGGEDFSLNFRKVGYAYSRVGEVLSMGCTNERCVLQLWLDSAPHRRIVLDPGFADIGCASFPGGGGFYVVCHLGKGR